MSSLESTQNIQEGMPSSLGSSDSPSYEIFTIANGITFTRLVMTLLFLWVFCADESRLAGTVIYILASVTDFLDGLIARSTKTVSWFGKVLDPIVDRLLLFNGVIGLLIRGELPAWVAIFVVGRDCYLAVGMRILHRYQTRPLDVVFIGKVTTALLMVGFCDLLLGFPVIDGLGLLQGSWMPLLNTQAAPVGVLCVYAGCVCSFITALIYTRQALAVRRVSLLEASENAS